LLVSRADSSLLAPSPARVDGKAGGCESATCRWMIAVAAGRTPGQRRLVGGAWWTAHANIPGVAARRSRGAISGVRIRRAVVEQAVVLAAQPTAGAEPFGHAASCIGPPGGWKTITGRKLRAARRGEKGESGGCRMAEGNRLRWRGGGPKPVPAISRSVCFRSRRRAPVSSRRGKWFRRWRGRWMEKRIAHLSAVSTGKAQNRGQLGLLACLTSGSPSKFRRDGTATRVLKRNPGAGDTPCRSSTSQACRQVQGRTVVDPADGVALGFDHVGRPTIRPAQSGPVISCRCRPKSIVPEPPPGGAQQGWPHL